MSRLDELGNAVMREVRKLCTMTAPMPIIMDPAVNKPVAVDKATGLTVIQRPARMFGGGEGDIVRRILRIEVSERFMWEVIRQYSHTGAYPTTFMDVAVYCCGPEHNLPECGWRVVNPFDKPVGG